MVRPSHSGKRDGLPRVLIFGGTGMLGHVLYGACRRRFDTHVTIRSECPGEVAARALDVDRIVGGVRADEIARVERAMDEISPDVVVNCIGVVKQRDVRPAEMIRANSL